MAPPCWRPPCQVESPDCAEAPCPRVPCPYPDCEVPCCAPVPCCAAPVCERSALCCRDCCRDGFSRDVLSFAIRWVLLRKIDCEESARTSGRGGRENERRRALVDAMRAS